MSPPPRLPKVLEINGLLKNLLSNDIFFDRVVGFVTFRPAFPNSRPGFRDLPRKMARRPRNFYRWVKANNATLLV